MMRVGIERSDDGRRALVLKRETPQPIEGTRMSLWNSIIPNWWAENIGTGNWFPGDAALAERVWVANRCIQLNAQQIASMPLQWHGPPDPTESEPAWISAPDPNWYPNGIGDALNSIVSLMYGWGFVCLYVTDFYATGFPRTWTVLDSSQLNIDVEDGRRRYKYGAPQSPLAADRIIQLDRNPGIGIQGTPALRSYAQQAWGLLAAGNQSMTVNTGGIPQAVLKSARKLTEDQADKIQTQWMEKTAARSGAPPILPPELDFQTLSFNPSDLALLETQEFNARAIATAFGVPAMLLNMPIVGGLTYQNPAALGEMWWRFELRPTATRIANALSAQMLPRGQFVTFDAADTFAAIDSMSEEDDPQLSQVAQASPAQQPRPLTAVGGGT